MQNRRKVDICEKITGSDQSVASFLSLNKPGVSRWRKQLKSLFVCQLQYLCTQCIAETQLNIRNYIKSDTAKYKGSVIG